MYNFALKNIYSFKTLAPSVLGSEFKNVKILGVVDYEIACSFLNVDLLQRSVYPLLPPGTPDDTFNYNYIMILTESGSKTVVAYEWIDEASIELVDSVTLTVVIPNSKTSDIVKIRNSLSLLGYTGFSITTS